jgi:hypothetical protein
MSNMSERIQSKPVRKIMTQAETLPGTTTHIP